MSVLLTILSIFLNFIPDFLINTFTQNLLFISLFTGFYFLFKVKLIFIL